MLLMASLNGALGKDAPRERMYRAVRSGLEGAGAGPQITAEELDLSGAAGLPEEAQFDLAGMRWDALLGRWEFQLRCRNRQQCVPFLVSAKAENRPELQAGAGQKQARLTVVRASGPIMFAGKRRPGAPAVEAGQNAKVSWSKAGLEISAQVVCLERGVEGQWIRVRPREGRGRVLRARVAGKGRLVAEPGEAQ
jgi:hypothetical protein